jgi:hypothetical protein
MANLQAKSDEIRTKIRCAALIKSANRDSSVDQQFAKASNVQFKGKEARVIIMGVGDREKFVKLVGDSGFMGPENYVLVHGPEALVADLPKKFAGSLTSKLQVCETEPPSIDKNKIYWAEFSKSLAWIKSKTNGKRVSLIVLGGVSEEIAKQVEQWGVKAVILEDLGVKSPATQKLLQTSARYYVPATSMLYHSNDELTKA